MKTVCDLNKCTGCLACTVLCPKNAIIIRDNLETYNAEINAEECISCGLCEKVCPNIHSPQVYRPIFWKQGWADDEIRVNASSGGAASAIIRSFILSGGWVASCCFENGDFSFILTDDTEKAKRFAGSKYVKSNPKKIYRDIRKLLIKGERVLFIGLPCQAAAVQNVCNDVAGNLYTVDLICHGTPSQKLLKKFIAECGYEWNSITDIQFREKVFFGLAINGTRITPRRVADSYLRVFLYGVAYTENCYFCRYSNIMRVSDITLGDAWGQMSDTNPDGVSLILCQTQKGVDIIKNAGIHLETVDLEKAIEANNQLRYPSEKHPGRERFFREIRKGHSIRRVTAKILPKESFKDSIKTGLIKAGIIKDL